jgi:hypothetical protein
VVEGSEMLGAGLPVGVAYVQDGEPVVDDGLRALLVGRDDPPPGDRGLPRAGT